MSTSPSAMPTSLSQLLEKPMITELYTIDINDNEKWYRVGLELGLGTDVLDSIKKSNVKPQLCKRAMFKEWLRKSSKATCTWRHLIQAIAKVDQKVAEIVAQDIIIESSDQQSPASLKPSTVQFPLEKNVGMESADDVKYASAPPTIPSDANKRHKLHHLTEIVSREGDSPTAKGTDDPQEIKPHLFVEGHVDVAHVEIEADLDFVSGEKNEVSFESLHESEHAVRGSLSADVYETASEDDSFMVFSSQQGGDTPDITSKKTVEERDKAILEACKTNNIEMIDLLLQRKELTGKTRLQNGRTPLMYAARHGSKVITAHLLKVEGPNLLKDVDKDGAMPLYFSVNEGYYEVAKILIEQHTKIGFGLDLVVKGTPIIIFPASKGFSMICELLLEGGANPNMKNMDGETALHVAAFHGHKDVVKMLLKFHADIFIISRKASMTPLEKAMEGRHVETIKILAQATFEAKIKNLELFTCKTREQIGKLVKSGAKVNFRDGDGTTALMRHAQRGSLDLVVELLECQAIVDLQDEVGESALMKATISGHVKVVDVLIEHQAILDLKTIKGHTALAFSVLHRHPHIVSKLLLAGADIRITDKNGRSVEELATYTGDQEIIEIIRRSRTVVKQEEPFINTLSDYFLKKSSQQRSKAKDQRKQAQKKELMSKMPVPPSSLEDEESTTQNQLKTAYERISVLETRVHDLSLQVTLDVPTDEDLSFLERKRLEAEFKKFKELKRKAELYAIEAKQTSQRLSAENSKLRDDLAKERRFNELTRESILNDIEKIMDDSVKLEEKAQAKLKVFEQEVASRARQLALTSSLVTVGKFDFTPEQIKKLILQHSLRMSLSVVAFGGLPCSGKSTLLRSMLQLKQDQEENVCQLPGLNVLEAAIISNPYTEEKTQWLSAITKADAELLMLAVCLAQVCAKQNQSLSLLDINEGINVIEPMFKSASVNRYFDRVFRHLRELLVKLENEGSLLTLQHASLAFMNIWDIGVNKAVFEAMSLFARRCHSLLLLNVLNLDRDATKLNDKLDFTLYSGRYSPRKDDQRVLQVQKAHVYYARFVEVCNQLPNTSALVGTHKDAFEGDKQKIAEVKSRVKHLVEEKVAGVAFTDLLHPHMLVVDARSEGDAKTMRKTVEEMIFQCNRFEKTVPLTWILLRGVLHSTDRLVLSKSELWSYASQCGIQTTEELDSWLNLFQSCMSIMYSSDERLTSLNQNVVIHPFKFIQCLDHVFYAEFSDILKSNTKLEKHLDLLQKGLLTYTLACEIWPDDLNSTAPARGENQNVLCSFMLRVLRDLKMCTKVKMAIAFDSEEQPCSADEQFFFIPSLRPSYSHSHPTQRSCSLIVMASNVHQAPCDIYSEFVHFIQQQERTKCLQLIPDERYDTVHLKWVENELPMAEIEFKMLDFEDMVEISVTIPEHQFSVQQSHDNILSLKQKVCSIMKTTCMEFLHEISQNMNTMTYNTCVVSPICENSPDNSRARVHVVPFEINGVEHLDSLSCYTCGKQAPFSQYSDQRTVWITCAYQGSPHKVVSKRDTLSRHDLVNVADDLYNHSSEKIMDLATNLQIPEADIVTLKKFCTPEDFPLLILLEWKKRQSVAGRPQLACALLRCGLRSLAAKLDLNLGSKCPSPQVHHHKAQSSLSSKELSFISQSIPQKLWREFGRNLGLSAKDIHTLQKEKDMPQSQDFLKQVLEKWLKNKGDRDEVFPVLKNALTSIGLRSIADYLSSSQINDSDADSESIK